MSESQCFARPNKREYFRNALYQAKEPDRACFVTSTIVAWLPVLTAAVRCDILVESLESCRKHKALRITAWVVLDNHFHAILAAPDLPRVMADFKTAHRAADHRAT